MAKLTDLWVHIGAKTDNLKKGIGDAEKQVKGFSSSINRLGGFIAGAFAISTVVSFAKQCGQLALGVDEIEMAFKRLNDPNLLANLRAATSGTVADVNLMKASIRAESLGIPIKQLGTYFEFAERQAGALGMSTEQVTEAIVNGIGNKATRAFRQLGISSIEVQRAFAGIEPELLTVEAVADRAFVMINEKLREMGTNTDSATDKIDRQSASWENARTSFGKFWNEFRALIAPGVTFALDKLTLFFQSGGNIQLMRATSKMMKDTEDASRKALKYEEDKNRVIAEGDAKKRIAADNARIAAENAKKVKGREVFDPLNPISPIQSEIPQQYDNLKTNIDKVTESYTNAKLAAQMFAESVAMSAGNVESFKDAANVIRAAARQAIAAFIAQTITAQVAKAAGKAPTWWAAILAGGAAAAATSALFSSVIPSFAQGGVVQGKQLAMVGDNPSGTEAIIPKEMWGRMGQNVNIQGIVRGKDLYWVMKNYDTHLMKTT